MSKSDQKSHVFWECFRLWLAEVTNLAKTPDPFAGGFRGIPVSCWGFWMTSQAHLQLWEERLFGKAVSRTKWYGMKRLCFGESSNCFLLFPEMMWLSTSKILTFSEEKLIHLKSLAKNPHPCLSETVNLCVWMLNQPWAATQWYSMRNTSTQNEPSNQKIEKLCNIPIPDIWYVYIHFCTAIFPSKSAWRVESLIQKHRWWM